MNKIIGFTVVFLLIAASQILRVRLLNILVSPHFTVGLRSGIFMNSVCSFLNIITPFRLGELYRVAFLRKRYGAGYSIALNAVVIERLFDTLLLLLLLVIVGEPNLLNGIEFQILFVIGSVLLFLSLIIISPKKNLHSQLLTWHNHLIYLLKSQKFYIGTLVVGISLTYWSAGIFTCRIIGTELNSWVEWNFLKFRLINLSGSESHFNSSFNIIFIFSFLVLGFCASLMGHRSNRFIDFLTGSMSDSFQGKRIDSFKNSNRLRTVFLESPYEWYWREINRSRNVKETHKGGSGALVISLNSPDRTIRKIGFGQQKSRLRDQFFFMTQHSERWSFPQVHNPIMKNSHFSYEMEEIAPTINIYDLIRSETKEIEIRRITEIVYNYIESGNSPVGQIELSDYQSQLNNFWNIKLSKIIAEVMLRVPELSSGSKIAINDEILDNLPKVFNQIRNQVLESQPILEVTFPHGDSTLGNLLYLQSRNTIIGLDPNPNQILRNASIDHGKVLQSLLLNYENTLAHVKITSIGFGQINYSVPLTRSIATSCEIYRSLIGSNSPMLKASEYMCFASMLRLLPYRLNEDRSTAPAFIAQTIEFGNKILEKRENAI